MDKRLKKTSAYVLSTCMLITSSTPVFSIDNSNKKVNIAESSAVLMKNKPKVSLETNDGSSTPESEFSFSKGTYADTGISGVITAYNGNSKLVDIPEYIDGIKVRGIGENVFKGMNLKEVTIPEGIEYIGKSAFENNQLKEVYIPNSVKEIDENAFKKANNDEYTKDGLTVTGMNGIKILKDGSFSDMMMLTMYIPSLEEINANAFEPEFEANFMRPSYVKLYTTNGNIHNLESKNNKYLVNPAIVNVRAISEDTEAVIASTEHLGSTYSTQYNRSIASNEFYTIGDTSNSINIGDNILGYARPKAPKSIEIKELVNNLDFTYKKINISAPASILKSSNEIKGKTNPNTKVVLKKGVKSGYYEEFEKYKEVTSEDDGTFIFDGIDTDGVSKFSIQAEVNDGNYEGKSYELKIALGNKEKPGIEYFELLKEINVIKGEKVKYPDTVIAKMTDGSTEQLDVYFTDHDSEKLGEHWVKGTVNYEGVDYHVYLKMNVAENNLIKETNKDDLIREIVGARKNLKDTVVSSDGNDVNKEDRWVTSDVAQKLKAAIDSANRIVSDKTVNQDIVNEELETLRTAVMVFNNAKKVGTKKSEKSSDIVRIAVLMRSGEDIDLDGISLKLVDLSNKVKTKIEPTSTNIDKKSRKAIFEFTDVPKGTWKFTASKGVILVDESGRRLSELAKTLYTAANGNVINKELNLEKGIKISYDLGEHGTTTDELDRYFIRGEHIEEQSTPIVTPKPGWIFIGWSIDGNTEIDLHRDVEGDLTLKALYKKDNGLSINENTEVGNGWKLGHFKFEKDTTEDPKYKDTWIVTGFSSSGKERNKKWYDLVIPTITINGEPVKSIGRHAFEGSELKSVTIQEGIDNIYSNAFYETGLENVYLSDGIKVIGGNAFLRNKLRAVSIPNSVVKINDGAFAENTITTVKIPEKVENIGGNAFADNGLEEVIFNNVLKRIGPRAFYGNRLNFVKVPNTLNSLADDSFERNRGLTNYGGKVGVIVGDGTSNPNKLRNSSFHIINPNLNLDDGLKTEKLNLYGEVLKLQRHRNDLFVSEDGSDVPKDEKWIDKTSMEVMEHALYVGYYVYYDDAVAPVPIGTQSVSDSNPTRHSIEEAKALVEQAEKMYKNAQNGKARKKIKNNILVKVGIQGIEWKEDITEIHEYVLKNKNDENYKRYRHSKVLDAVPHLAFLSYSVPDGEYEIVAPVGKVFTKYYNNTDNKPHEEDNLLVESPTEKEYGFGSEDGVVVIYDLMDKGTSSDLLYETIIKEHGAKKLPKVSAAKGYKFKGWSIDGENIVEAQNLKLTGTTILKAVYAEGEDTGEEIPANPEDNKQKSKLISLIKEVEELVKKTEKAEDGKNIQKDKYWATDEVISAIKAELAEANFIYEDEDASEEDITNAIKNLNDKFIDFKSDRKPGKKEVEKTPDKPETPNKPETPDKPETPNKPETPDKPETPNKPEKPNKPDKNTGGHSGGGGGGTFGSSLNTLSDEAKDASIMAARISGEDRYSTAIEISKKFYSNADTVILARGDVFADSMSASVLSKQLKAPILLSEKSNMNSKVMDEIQRLGAKKVIVIGGESSLSKGVSDSIIKKGLKIERISGRDRYETSALIAKKVMDLNEEVETAVLVSGNNFSDAISISPYAAMNEYPILLVGKNGISSQIKDILNNENIKKVVIVGGYNSVSHSIEKNLSKNVERISGKDRYETSLNIVKYKFETNDNIFLASGNNFADALVVGPVAGMKKSPIVLISNKNIDYNALRTIKGVKMENVNIIGGVKSISDKIVKSILK